MSLAPVNNPLRATVRPQGNDWYGLITSAAAANTLRYGESDQLKITNGLMSFQLEIDSNATGTVAGGAVVLESLSIQSAAQLSYSPETGAWYPVIADWALLETPSTTGQTAINGNATTAALTLGQVVRNTSGITGIAVAAGQNIKLRVQCFADGNAFYRFRLTTSAASTSPVPRWRADYMTLLDNSRV